MPIAKPSVTCNSHQSKKDNSFVSFHTCSFLVWKSSVWIYNVWTKTNEVLHIKHLKLLFKMYIYIIKAVARTAMCHLTWFNCTIKIQITPADPGPFCVWFACSLRVCMAVPISSKSTKTCSQHNWGYKACPWPCLI